MSSGKLESFFVEHRLLTELSNGPEGLAPTRSERDAGWCADFLQHGEASHLWAPLPPGAPAPQPLPAEAWTAFGPHRPPDALGAPELEPLRELTRALEAAVVRAGGEALEVFIQDAQQRVLCGPGDAWAEAHRRHTVLEARVSVKGEGRPASLWRPFGFADPGALLASAARVEASCVELVGALRDGLPVVPCPEGELPVVFPPGAASGSFFHEVCGHPLEGDVVARRGSYLALRLGQRVAEEFVTVRDDPTEARGSL
ncbi:MAG TPA: metallopeptidase TldD-related protein, partial [Longimicrobium sp.]|nr:metallopeptidase TldD-related protein [Longimicrobium sp.]